MQDAYRYTARIYDRLFDNMNKGLRMAGLRMFRPLKGMNILDVGCGTGTHLELYQRYESNLFGIDLSPSMLEIARRRLGSSARLDLGNATSMPYDDHMFDLSISMLSLHEMSHPTRLDVLSEMKRVIKDNGHMLLIDFHPGPYQPLQGWISKIVIFLSELAAGREHFKNYRQFMAAKCVPGLLPGKQLAIEKERVLAGGTFAIHLVAPL